MATLKDFRDERIKKMEKLQSMGFDPYPATVRRTQVINDVLEKFDDFAGSTETIFGRIKSIRRFGKIAFVVIRDFTGSIQLFLRTQDVQPSNPGQGLIGINDLNLLDTGDFIEATGEVKKTLLNDRLVVFRSIFH